MSLTPPPSYLFSYDDTYKELKLFSSYSSFSGMECYDDTYKELKHLIVCVDQTGVQRYDDTYKELKHRERSFRRYLE